MIKVFGRYSPTPLALIATTLLILLNNSIAIIIADDDKSKKNFLFILTPFLKKAKIIVCIINKNNSVFCPVHKKLDHSATIIYIIPKFCFFSIIKVPRKNNVTDKNIIIGVSINPISVWEKNDGMIVISIVVNTDHFLLMPNFLVVSYINIDNKHNKQKLITCIGITP